MSLVLWLVFGYIAGSVALWLVPPREPVPGWQPIAFGVAGSIAGGLTSSLFSGDQYAPAGFVWSIIGAVGVTLAYRWYTESK